MRIRATLICLAAIVAAVTPAEAQPALPGLASHTAIYDISLTRATQAEGVRGAAGKMTYAVTDRCDGYTIESDIDAALAFSNGDGTEIVKRFAGWESKDGRRATFRMQTFNDGEANGTYTGHVDLAADGSGRLEYVGADTKSFDLPRGSMLSVVQLRRLIQAAQANQSLVSQSVVDGAFEDGPYRVTGFIAPARPLASADGEELSMTVAADAELLSANMYWPVTLAYFPLGKGDVLPEYEVSIQLLPNGVIRSMVQDFGTYTLKMDLARLSARESNC